MFRTVLLTLSYLTGLAILHTPTVEASLSLNRHGLGSQTYSADMRHGLPLNIHTDAGSRLKQSLSNSRNHDIASSRQLFARGDGLKSGSSSVERGRSPVRGAASSSATSNDQRVPSVSFKNQSPHPEEQHRIGSRQGSPSSPKTEHDLMSGTSTNSMPIKQKVKGNIKGPAFYKFMENDNLSRAAPDTFVAPGDTVKVSKSSKSTIGLEITALDGGNAFGQGEAEVSAKGNTASTSGEVWGRGQGNLSNRQRVRPVPSLHQQRDKNDNSLGPSNYEQASSPTDESRAFVEGPGKANAIAYRKYP